MNEEKASGDKISVIEQKRINNSAFETKLPSTGCLSYKTQNTVKLQKNNFSVKSLTDY